MRPPRHPQWHLRNLSFILSAQNERPVTIFACADFAERDTLSALSQFYGFSSAARLL